jgi:hypothetical protein
MRVAVLSYLTRSCSGKLLDLRSQSICGHATILKPPIPFHTITIDFTIGLPDTGTYNAIKSVTDKFTKRNMAIPGRDTWLALQWADVLLGRLAESDCGPPKRIISDRDPKFVAQMWKGIFKLRSTELRYTTAYHPQADGQSERFTRQSNFTCA